jgi:hypothetical protein
MEQSVHEDPRSANDSRARKPVEAAKEKPMQATPAKPSLGQRWGGVQPTKTHLVWACILTAIITMIIGFNWGGWVTGGNSLKAGVLVGQDAVVQRLAPICFAQFNQIPDKAVKMGELKALSSYQQTQYVQDQGWATMPGEEKPERKVAENCAKLILAANP